METQRRGKIDAIDTRAADSFFPLGCGNNASLGNL